MAAFFEQLWESIFTAGPTPTLLVATNASFAALQVLLFVMLVVTYSIHFVILSVLCGGLWWSINWFAAEIKAAQAKEEEAKRIREARRSGKDRGDAQAQAPVSTGSGGPTAASTTGTTTSLAAPVDEAVKRRKGMGESTGDISTDSEWDKLSEDSEDR
ncbi:er membrane protein [Pyrenophora tritici-repentis]|nr:er membrane protein [Pyrenophora tritici-repentis]KAI1528875.1 er membrane protein [Pyrenophora tritici-repentis]KAI1563227.1 er membrane protein [Pyrenophora tritici-repentis]KAI1566589.1 er membrane protein [Pyrenophora tritici-repentis]KAI1596857.1 er membrane protein [Pyrenophora tritici-repentis]